MREIDLRGGRSTAAVSASCDPRLVDSAGRMLGALGWHGVAMAEFKWDETSNQFWLLEINGRFWGSLPLALAAGVDFPYYLYQLAVGQTPEPAASYAEGVLARGEERPGTGEVPAGRARVARHSGPPGSRGPRISSWI